MRTEKTEFMAGPEPYQLWLNDTIEWYSIQSWELFGLNSIPIQMWGLHMKPNSITFSLKSSSFGF